MGGRFVGALVLRGCVLGGSDLGGDWFSGAVFSGAVFSGALVHGSWFMGAYFLVLVHGGDFRDLSSWGRSLVTWRGIWRGLEMPGEGALP